MNEELADALSNLASLPDGTTPASSREDPEKCSFTHCMAKRVPGLKQCEAHYQTPTKLKKLGHMWADVGRLKDSKSLLDTDENVALLEAIQQKKIQSCKTPLDIALQASDLSINEERIMKAKVMSHKLALARGKVMDQSILMSLIDEISLTIKEEVTSHVLDESIRVALLETLSQKITAKAMKALDAAVEKATQESEAC